MSATADPHAGVKAVKAATPAASAAAAHQTVAAANDAKTATTGAAAATLIASVVAFLAGLRELHRNWLTTHLAGHGTPDDIANTISQEMAYEMAFAQASAERLARSLPAALAIADPVERAAKVQALLDAEQRYAQQRGAAMAERAFAALERASVRRVSPAGAFWQLGIAHHHTDGCRFMGGKPWPWAVLDRVHPPRHPGCVSRLLSVDEAVDAGLMGRDDMPSDRDAIRRTAGVMMESYEVDALLLELDVRDALVEAGIDRSQIDQIPHWGIL